MDSKGLENSSRLGNFSERFFDNSLRQEFLTFPQVVDFFDKYGEKWVRQQMTVGNLPYHTYGRDGVLFYIPEVRQAILDGNLAPIRRKNHDQNSIKKKRYGLRSIDQVSGTTSLEDLRKSL